MKNNVLYVLNELCGSEGIGKKKLQKLVYLLTQGGVDLGFRYSIHYYGPYSAGLNQAVYALQSENAISIKTESSTHVISSNRCDVENPFNKTETRILHDTIERFADMTPLMLEVLTTTHYVATVLLDRDVHDEDMIVEKVKQIKGRKFSERQIRESIATLCKFGYLVR